MRQRRNHHSTQAHRAHGCSKRHDEAHTRISVRERKTPVDQLRQLSEKDLNSAMAYQPRTQDVQAKYGGVLQNQYLQMLQNQYLQNQVLIIYRNFNRHTYSVMHQGHTTFTHFDDLQQLGKLPSHVSLHNQVVSNNSRHKKNKPLSVYASISQFCRKRHHGEYTRIAHEHNHHENTYLSLKCARNITTTTKLELAVCV